jgi:hypothetical protein
MSLRALFIGWWFIKTTQLDVKSFFSLIRGWIILGKMC